MEKERGGTDTVTETVTAGAVRRGRKEDGNDERGGGREWGGQRGPGEKKKSVDRGCVGVLGILRGGRCELGSAPITFLTGVTVVWNRR